MGSCGTLRIEAGTAYVVVNLGAQTSPLIERAVEAKRFGASDGAVERAPGHGFGIGEMARAAAHLPHAFVRLSPHRGEVIEQSHFQRPAGARCGEAALAALVERAEQFAKHIELELDMGGVADAHWPPNSRSPRATGLPIR